jgi:hypothetical protein
MLETLEDRRCPTVNFTLASGNLFIMGAPNGVLSITEMGTRLFRVKEGATTIATFPVPGSIFVTLARRTDAIDVALNPSGLGGNLLMNLGAGDTLPPNSIINIHGGRIFGSLTIVKGSGGETFSLGLLPGNLVHDPLSVGGDVNVVASLSSGVGGGQPRDTLILDAGSSINGNLQTTNVDSVLLASVPALPAATVSGNLTVNNNLEKTTPDVTVLGQVGKNVTVTGPATGSSFALIPGVPGAGLIGGNLSVNSLGGTTLVQLAPGSEVQGNAGIQTGTGADLVQLGGLIDGDAQIGTDGGNDNVSLVSGAAVSGNLRVIGGNGNNTLALSGTVSGNLFVQQGNGNVTATVGVAPSGVLGWVSGNGNDLLTLGSAAAPAGSDWNSSIRFGNGDDTLTLSATAPANQFLRGLIDGGGRLLGNTFNPTAPWVLSPNLTQANFP